MRCDAYFLTKNYEKFTYKTSTLVNPLLIALFATFPYSACKKVDLIVSNYEYFSNVEKPGLLKLGTPYQDNHFVDTSKILKEAHMNVINSST